MTVTPNTVGRASDGIYVGASGWSYPEWRGTFYPADAKPDEFLRLYAERLNAVELNATYYRLPSEAQFESWAAQVPDGFRFAVKLSRQITEGGRLDRIGTFAERVAALGDRLGPVLVRIPDAGRSREGMLRFLLDSLPLGLQVAVEPLHPSWEGVELPVRVNGWEPGAPFRYLRLRDHSGLDGVAARIAAETVPVYCFVNRGEAADHAPDGEPTAAIALRLSSLLA